MGARPGAGILFLMGAVVTWLLGCDVLYSLQDEEFDRGEGLRSIPARFGRDPVPMTPEAIASVGFDVNDLWKDSFVLLHEREEMAERAAH